MKRYAITAQGAAVEIVGVTTIEGKPAFIVNAVRDALSEGEILLQSDVVVVNDPRLDTADTGKSRSHVASPRWRVAMELAEYADYLSAKGGRVFDYEVSKLKEIVRAIRVQEVKRARQ